jgi:hypothetical protein
MTLAQEAHDYAAMGWAVFPLQPREKKPYGFTTGLHAARADVGHVVAWWAGRERLPLRERRASDKWFPAAGPFPKAASNIGLRTGAASGLWVLDVDGAEGIASLLGLSQKHGRLPATVRQKTGGGGGQLFYAWPGMLPWRTEIRNSASKAQIGQHLDVRGEGGYVVLPPSIHPSGRAYEWVEGCAPWECELARAPWWLLRLVAPPAPPAATATFERRERIGGAGYGVGALHAAAEEIAAAPSGQRNVTFHRNAYGIGRLVAGGVLAEDVARRELLAAGERMARGDAEYGYAALVVMIENAFTRAQAAPKAAPEGRR